MFKNESEIFQALLDGDKLKSIYDDIYIFLDEDGIVKECNIITGSITYPLKYKYDRPESWVIYEEPKKKIKKYLYVYSTDFDRQLYCDGIFYNNDNDFKNRNPEADFFQKLMFSEIEVEE